ncbi:hypothetical protein BXZ70DRAFT_369123 [Cristinia sonorae]|uniref:MYND-type domain-containing protein n=1 Tax=Cristinia sonorae TaxID=1940300 RepID=A0A8K0XN67_9AGAR|nr:hypothetical protein BXZ70DRAFT_369123 [Cristinia sonorae]
MPPIALRSSLFSSAIAMALFDSDRVRPDKHKSPALWNKSWEDDLQLYEVWGQRGVPIIPGDILPSNTGVQDSDLNTMRRNILDLQSDIRRSALEYLTTDHFAAMWAEQSPEKRKEHILGALVKTCTMMGDVELLRKWCPDMSLKNLGQEPQSYLAFLMSVIEGEDGKIKSFPHTVVDALFDGWAKSAGRGGMVFIEKMRLDRIYFVSTVLWKTLLSFYGKDEAIRYKISGSTEAHRRAMRDIRSDLRSGGQQDRALLRSIKRTMSAKHAEERGICWGCGKTRAELGVDTVFQACSGCKKINKIILYCSRECQKRDWKTGFAGSAPHKEECGKPWEDSVPAESISST